MDQYTLRCVDGLLLLKSCSKSQNKLTVLLCLQEGFAPPEEGGDDVNEFGYADEQDEY